MGITNFQCLILLGASHSAACLLVVIDKMEGGVLARALALQVLQIALTSGEYDLVAELLRYAVTQSDFDLIFSKEAPSTSPPAEEQSSVGSWFSWIWGTSQETQTASQRSTGKAETVSGASLEAAKVLSLESTHGLLHREELSVDGA